MRFWFSIEIISNLAPFSLDGKREFYHFLFCRLLAEEKLNKSGDLGERKQPSHPSEGLTKAVVLCYIPFIKAKHVFCLSLPSSTVPGEQFPRCTRPMRLTIILSLVPSPLVDRNANRCPIECCEHALE